MEKIEKAVTHTKSYKKELNASEKGIDHLFSLNTILASAIF